MKNDRIINSTPKITSPLPYPYPIPHKNLTLLITYLSAPLPIFEFHLTLQTALQRIQPALRIIPDHRIGEGGFENNVGRVQVVVTAYEGAEMSWWQLGRVLEGLENFASGGGVWKMAVVGV